MLVNHRPPDVRRLALLCRRFLLLTGDILATGREYPGGVAGLLEDRTVAAAFFVAVCPDEHTAREAGPSRPPTLRRSRDARRASVVSLSTRVDPGSPHGTAPARGRH